MTRSQPSHAPAALDSGHRGRAGELTGRLTEVVAEDRADDGARDLDASQVAPWPDHSGPVADRAGQRPTPAPGGRTSYGRPREPHTAFRGPSRKAPRAGAVAGALATAALLLVGCSGAPASAPSPSDGLSGKLTIFAAASLASAFDEIAEVFEAEHPAVDLTPIVYDGSSILVTQLREGAHADVLATADERTMQTLTDAGLADDPRAFATNSLVVAVPAGNPGHVETLADLADVTTVLCAPEVPCGAASQRLLSAADIAVAPASQEQNVSAVLQKIAAGEADAGLVYATDVIGDDAVESFAPDGAEDVVNRYPIAVLDGASAAGRAFVEFVLGPSGQQILAAHGFGAP